MHQNMIFNSRIIITLGNIGGRVCYNIYVKVVFLKLIHSLNKDIFSILHVFFTLSVFCFFVIVLSLFIVVYVLFTIESLLFALTNSNFRGIHLK